MRWSVIFGIMLRLLVINISSSSPAVNTAAYYQRCVITCRTVAVVHRRPRLQHLPVAVLTQAVKPDIDSESRFLPTLPAFDAPIRGSHWNIAVPFGMEKLEWRGYPTVKIFLYVYSFWHNSRTWQMDRQTDTAWRHRPHLHSIARQKWVTILLPILVSYAAFCSTPQTGTRKM